MSDTLTKVVVDCLTGASEIVELTAEEIAQREADIAAELVREAERAAQAQAKANIKASALAKLAELGLTEDEAKAIAG